MKIRGFEVVADKHRKHGETEIILPKRGSKHSAGYDFYSPEEVIIPAGEQRLIWTDVKSYMQKDEVLFLVVRSSIGIKKGLQLANTVGIIDSDYYGNPENDGNIGICLKNTTDTDILIEAGERIAQGIFLKFFVGDAGNTEEERTGGIGSTNK